MEKLARIPFLLFCSCYFFFNNASYAQLIPNTQDCLGAIPVIYNIYHQPNSFVGTGNYTNEINATNSCLKSGEKNDVWYKIVVQTSGNLDFSITPNSLTDDYDFALYDITQFPCDSIFTNTALELSCNYSGWPGVTGANGLAGAQNNPTVPLLAGRTYVLNVSNFSSTQYGYTLDFNNLMPIIGTVIAGSVFKDTDSDCQIDAGEITYANQLIDVNNGSFYVSTNSNGYYAFVSSLGIHTLSLVTPSYYNQDCPASNASLTVNANMLNAMFDNNNFAMSATSAQDLKIELTNVTPVISGDTTRFDISFQNLGATGRNGSIDFHFDPFFNYVSSSVLPFTLSTDSMSFNFTNLLPFESRTISVNLSNASTVQIGTLLTSLAKINPVNNDTVPTNNYDTLITPILGSTVSNTLAVSPVGLAPNGQISINQQLTYTIRYRNTGTAPVLNLRVTDTLSPFLDPSTFRMLTSSHDYNCKISNNGLIEWIFYNILLPDSGTNKDESAGYIKFTVSPKLNAPVNSLIRNRALIAFDNSAPVFTEEILNTIMGPLSVSNPFESNNSLQLFPNPGRNSIQIKSATIPLKQIFVSDLLGRILIYNEENNFASEINTSKLKQGTYSIRVVLQNNSTSELKWIKL